MVLCSGYPTVENPYNCTWAHTRNKYYLDKGIVVDVMVMGGESNYIIDGVKVLSHAYVKENLKNGKYSLVISHSPNLRKHLPFLWRIKSLPIILFMHGSESMYINKDYPEPYDYMREGYLMRIIRSLYDNLKFIVLRKYILDRKKQVRLVFVSHWMKETFERNVFDTAVHDVQFDIINNSLSDWALSKTHNFNYLHKKADFVTLRRLDSSKFAIDLVVKHAIANPNYSYHIYGKGKYFLYNEMPSNITLFDRHIKSEDIPDLLDFYPCAIMPTRCDAQGVMVCEMATFGMKVITTDIAVNHEMFNCFENVKLLTEKEFSKKLELNIPCDFLENKNRFSFENTLKKELQLILSMER